MMNDADRRLLNSLSRQISTSSRSIAEWGHNFTPREKADANLKLLKLKVQRMKLVKKYLP